MGMAVKKKVGGGAWRGRKGSAYCVLGVACWEREIFDRPALGLRPSTFDLRHSSLVSLVVNWR